jgi:hypothetical protein
MFNQAYGPRFFEGVVESRLDPLEIGRVQVRVFGIHTDNLQQLPESDLHWMQVMMPTTSAATSGVGQTANLVEGSHVVGYFLDGESCQNGIVLGSINGIPQQARKLNKGFSDHRTSLGPTQVPGKPQNVTYSDSGVSVTEANRPAYPKYIDEPDTSRLARNSNAAVDTVLDAKKKSQALEKNIPKAGGGTFSEPEVPYAAKYPYNQVTETESGHVQEFDNTPGQERVHLAHRTGSFVEMHKNGTVVNKAAKDSYDITHNNSFEHVHGEKVITVDKGAKLLVNAKGGGDGFIIEVNDGGDLTIKVKGGTLNIDVEGDISTKCSGDYVVDAEGQIKLTGTTISLN